MLPDIKEGATEEEVARTSHIPCPKMLMKVNDLVMLTPVTPMGRPIPSLDETAMLLHSRPAPRQVVNHVVIVLNPRRCLRNVSNSSRSDTGTSRCNPINHAALVNPHIEARFECLKAGYEHHENRLNDHDTRLKEHEARLATQDGISEKSNEILESLKNTLYEHLGWTRATHGIAAASYFKWHGDIAIADCLKVENILQFYEMKRVLRHGASRGQEAERRRWKPSMVRRPMGIVIPKGEG